MGFSEKVAMEHAIWGFVVLALGGAIIVAGAEIQLARELTRRKKELDEAFSAGSAARDLRASFCKDHYTARDYLDALNWGETMRRLRDYDRAMVEAGYMSNAKYVELWGQAND